MLPSAFDLPGATEEHSDGDIALAPCHKSLFLADFKLQVPECMPTTILSRYEASIAAIILRCSARAVPPTNRVGARWPLGAGATSVPLGYQLCAVTSMPTKLTINSGKGFIDLHSCAATTLSLLTEKSLRFPAAKSAFVAASMVESFSSTRMSGVNRMSDATWDSTRTCWRTSNSPSWPRRVTYEKLAGLPDGEVRYLYSFPFKFSSVSA